MMLAPLIVAVILSKSRRRLEQVENEEDDVNRGQKRNSRDRNVLQDTPIQHFSPIERPDGEQIEGGKPYVDDKAV